MGKFARGIRTDTTPNPHLDDLSKSLQALGDESKEPPKSPRATATGVSNDSAESGVQSRLFHRRVSTRFPNAAQGRHLAFGCIADDGWYFYCKEDRDGLPVRATEWMATRLARLCGIATADCAIIEDPSTGEELFGSRQPDSVADRFTVAAFLSQTHTNELGEVSLWPGQYLARLRALDMFIDNPDRGNDNFVLARDGLQTNLCAIDFGSARLFRCTTDAFPVESERTISVGKLHQQIHGSHLDSAVEMLEQLARIPADIVRSILNELPDSWLSESQRGTFNGFWSDGRKEQRIKNLRSALSG
jgi:hypothetical protein